jgi:hypothetical protein
LGRAVRSFVSNPHEEEHAPMPRIVTTVHDPVALATTCRRLGLARPVEQAVQLDAEEVFGWVVRLPGLRYPVVCDTLTGLVAYHPLDNAHHRYLQIMRFIHRYYDVQAGLRRGDGAPVTARHHPRVVRLERRIAKLESV